MSLQIASLRFALQASYGRSAPWLLKGRQAPTGRRLLSSAELEAAEEATVKAEESYLITRHGEGDGVVTLNVGGKEFITLRSTIQNNHVLQNRVLAAEANQEFTNGAVFIDRDPTYFHLILQHLRNRADLLHNPGNYTASGGMFPTSMTNSLVSAKKKIFGKKDVLIQLPEKKEAVRDLYVEARYFQIKELEALLCSIDWYTRAAQWFGSGSTNPFYAASQAISTARRALVASSGFGILLGAQNEDLVKNVKGLFKDVVNLLRGTPKDAEDGASEASDKSKENSFSFS